MKFLKNVFALLAGIVISVLLLEVFLHIYNPLAPRVQGHKIVLPVNRKSVIKNDKIKKLDALIYQSRNSLGFRGPEPPKNIPSVFSIICVGGSTTECFYLSDTETWPYRLQEKLKTRHSDVWVNNAGLDGHSTFGHLFLMDQLVLDLKPKYVLFLTGVNDLGRTDLSAYDQRTQEDSPQSFKEWLYRNCQILSTIDNIKKSAKAQELGVGHASMDLTTLDTLNISVERADSALLSHKELANRYASRLMALADKCKQKGITPVFITQPMLWGYAIDPETGVILDNVDCGIIPCGIRWQIMEMYNEAMRSFCSGANIQVIDLANELPKSSRYFYDEIHFTPEGADTVATIINSKLP